MVLCSRNVSVAGSILGPSAWLPPSVFKVLGVWPGRLTGSYQHKEGFGGSGRPSDSAFVDKGSLSVKCTRGVCSQGFRLGNQSWAVHAWFHWRSRAMPGFGSLLSPSWVSAGLRGCLEAGRWYHQLHFEHMKLHFQVKWENSCGPVALRLLLMVPNVCSFPS